MDPQDATPFDCPDPPIQCPHCKGWLEADGTALPHNGLPPGYGGLHGLDELCADINADNATP